MATSTSSSTSRSQARPGAPDAQPVDDSLPKAVLQRVKQDQASILASAIAFWGFLSIFPAVIAAMTIYGLVADPAQVQSTVTSVFGDVSPKAQELLSSALSDVAGGSGGLTVGLVLSLLGLLWTASAVTAYLLRASSLATEQQPRSSLKARLLAIPLTLAFLLVAALVIGVVAVLPVVLRTLGIGGLAGIGATAGAYVLLLALLVGTGTALYHHGPAEGGPGSKQSAIGAAVAAGVWLLGSIAFTAYVTTFGSYSATYGAVAGVIVVLLWFYLSAFSIVLGVIVASALDRRRTAVTPYP